MPENLPPECSVVRITSSADLPGNLGCASTGMPRPLSLMVSRLPGSSVTSMRLAWPATASSIAVVEHFGGEMVQRALVDAADVHAGAAADRLEPFEHLDRGGVVAFGCGRGGVGSEQVGHVAVRYRARDSGAVKRRGGGFPQATGGGAWPSRRGGYS